MKFQRVVVATSLLLIWVGAGVGARLSLELYESNAPIFLVAMSGRTVVGLFISIANSLTDIPCPKLWLSCTLQASGQYTLKVLENKPEEIILIAIGNVAKLATP